METYKSSYTKDEDRLLWELHEIRQKLQKKRKGKSLEEINREAFEKYYNWQKKREYRQEKTV
ncbi:hypothetical protein QUF80_16330 [Desulfococcaceae bacterium HSG8]|nr:hypothetical protein [Desulfococcaceae bacterium HSG8]